jgi:hypothetical protein
MATKYGVDLIETSYMHSTEDAEVFSKSFDTLEEAQAYYKQQLELKHWLHGKYCIVELLRKLSGNEAVIIKHGYKQSAQLPENGVVVTYQHIQHLHYAYKITDVRFADVNEQYTHLNENQQCAYKNCDAVFDTIEDMQKAFNARDGVPFDKMQTGSSIIEDFLNENLSNNQHTTIMDKILTFLDYSLPAGACLHKSQNRWHYFHTEDDFRAKKNAVKQDIKETFREFVIRIYIDHLDDKRPNIPNVDDAQRWYGFSHFYDALKVTKQQLFGTKDRAVYIINKRNMFCALCAENGYDVQAIANEIERERASVYRRLNAHSRLMKNARTYREEYNNLLTNLKQ